jgi:hypothetical protein
VRLGFQRGFWRGRTRDEGRQGSGDPWTTTRLRRSSARRGEFGNMHEAVDCFQEREREMAGAAMGGGVLRPLVDCVVPLQIR